MSVRKISASYIFTLNGTPLKDGIVVVSDDGEIIDVIDVDGELSEIEGLERYSGILVPAFVNAHSHLECSYYKGLIEQGIGVPSFVAQMSEKHSSDEDWIKLCARQADRYMKQTGCVAVGDISSNSVTLEIKEQSDLFYYTFLENLAIHPKQAPRMVEYALFLGSLYDAAHLEWSFSPHATYSVSKELIQLIGEQKQIFQKPVQFHYLETQAEDLLFRSKKGALVDFWNRMMPKGFDFWESPHTNTSEATIPFFARTVRLMLIHALYLDEEHIQVLKRERNAENTFLVTCPRSNLYIENALPNYRLWKDSGFPIAIGTDSLASNDSLSMIEELKCLQNRADIDLETSLCWACKNGAKALDIWDWAGSIEIGKRPGITLISGVDFHGLKLRDNASAKRLV